MMPSCDQTGVPGLVGDPLPLLDDVRVCFLDELAHSAEGFPAPVPELGDSFRDELRCRLALARARLFHVSPPAAPLGGIRQHEQIQTGEQEQGEREQRRVGDPGRRHPTSLCQGDEVGDDSHRKGDGQPAVDLPNPLVQFQDFNVAAACGRWAFNTELLGVLGVQPLPAAELHRLASRRCGRWEFR